MKYKKIIFGIIIPLILVVILMLFLNNKILTPSYYSVIAACYPEEFEKISKENGMIIVGEAILHKNQEIEIKIFRKDKKVLKHEIVHVSQLKSFRKNWLGCNNIILKYFTEIEAHIGQEIPDPIFEIIYGEIPEI